MTTFIEAAVTLVDIAKTMKTTVARVEADCRDLNLHVGQDWSGKPAISVRDAASLVSGDARRGHDHAAAHGHWRAAVEAWELQREQVRQQAFTDHFDAARRRGVGDPQASSEAAQVASLAILDYEKSRPQPVFADTETPRLSKRVKELLSK